MERLTKRIPNTSKNIVVYTKGEYKETIAEEMTGSDIRFVLRTLANYEDLEEQGLLLRLPCKVGQQVYEIYRFFDRGAWEIEVHKIKLEDLEKIGKTVFLTRAEAEEALQGIRRKESENE